MFNKIEAKKLNSGVSAGCVEATKLRFDFALKFYEVA